MTLTESIVRQQIGTIHAYVLENCNYKYKTTTFSPVEEIDYINTRRGMHMTSIENGYGLVGLYSFGQKYENVLAIYSNGTVKEHVEAGFPQYISLFVAGLFQRSQENLNILKQDTTTQ